MWSTEKRKQLVFVHGIDRKSLSPCPSVLSFSVRSDSLCTTLFPCSANLVEIVSCPFRPFLVVSHMKFSWTFQWCMLRPSLVHVTALGHSHLSIVPLFPPPHPYELSPDFDWFLGFDQCLQIRINFWTSCILLCISLSKSFSQKIGWKDRVNNWRCEMVTNFWWILSLRMLKENGKKAWILSLHLQSIERRQICTGQCYHDLTWIHQKPTPELLCFVMTEWNELLCKIQAALFYWLGVLQIGKFCDSFLQKCSSIAMLLMPGLSTATERQEFQSHKVWFVATSDR